MIDQSNKKDYQGPLYARHPDLVKRTQNKENYYYWFWIIAMITFIVPQVFTAWAYINIVDIMKSPIKVEMKDGR